MKLDDLINNAKEQKTSVIHKNKYDTNLPSLPINDKIHLYNHLNYLCRTDSGQRWTNELTNDNPYMFYLPSHEKFQFFFANNLEERIKIKEHILEKIKNLAETKGLKLDKFAKKLQQIRVDYLDSTVYGFNDAVKSDTVEFLNELAKHNPKFNLICSVIHTDQKENYVHIHFLYLID